MKKIVILLALSIIFTLLVPVSTTHAGDISSTKHEIVISTGDEKTTVRETITLQGNTNGNISINIWIQNGAGEPSVFVKGAEIKPDYNSSDDLGSIYTITLTEISNIEINYKLDKDVKDFQKKLLLDTDSLKITFNDNELYTGRNLATNASFKLTLYAPTETPLSIYIIVGVLLLVIVVAVATSYLLRRQKVSKIKKIASESEELLNTKKLLLMDLLKELEKQHRANQITDDTYHKLKEQYKQEAVEAMKHLEDMKLKVK